MPIDKDKTIPPQYQSIQPPKENLDDGLTPVTYIDYTPENSKLTIKDPENFMLTFKRKLSPSSVIISGHNTSIYNQLNELGKNLMNGPYKLSGREKKIKRPGFLFIVISAVIGALLGVTYLFNDMEFIEYAMYMPHFAFPATSSFLLKFYWFSQLLFIVMICWLVYRSIKAFGPLYGILRSVVVLIAGIAIFWTTLATSFLAVIGILILTFTSTAALSAGDGPTEYTTIKEKTFTSSGEKENVIIKHDNSGHIKSKSNF